MSNDLAKKPMMTLQRLETFLSDIRSQPVWRPEGDLSADYYDNKQLTAEMLTEMESRGQPPIIHNLIAPTIDGILGLEAKTRADWKLVADDDSGLPVVEALGQELNEAARISMADRSCADAYAAQIKVGLGWVEVNRESDPFKYKYTTNYVHRREIWWDWHSKRPDMQDARWLLRRKWLDTDVLTNAFPEHEDLINSIANGWSGWDQFGELQTLMGSENMMSAYAVQQSTVMQDGEWWDTSRKRALVYEVYYRVQETKPVIKTDEGEAFLYDPKNQAHVAAVASGVVTVSTCSFSRMRLAFFIGPHRVADLDSPHPHDNFPYVPFFGYREDRTSIPYGLIRRMIPAQDEINHRRSKLTYLLNVKRMILDNDALHGLTQEQAMDELHRADGIITLNPSRKNHDAFRVETDSGIASQQFQVLLDSQKLIQDVAGVWSAVLGKESGAQSGVAINSLVEQGTVTLAELNDNYRFSRKMVGELLLAHIVDDIADREKSVRINVNKPSKTKTVVLNQRVIADDGKQTITNSVTRTKTQVVLSDITATAGYRQQMNAMLTDMVSKLPPEYQVPLLELVIESSDLSNRDEVLAQIRKVSGAGDQKDMTPEEIESIAAKKEQDAQAAQLQFDGLKASVDKQVAEAKKLMAEAAAIEGDASIELETKRAMLSKIQAETKKIVTDVVVARKSLITTIDSEIQKTTESIPGMSGTNKAA